MRTPLTQPWQPLPRFGILPMAAFAVATLVPLGLLMAGAVQSGVWIWAGLVWMTVMTASLDLLVRRVLPAGGEEEFPAPDALSVVLALGQIALLGLTVAALGAPGGGAGSEGGGGLSTAEKLGLFVAVGLTLGQVGNANAHELIHRPGRWRRGLGVLFYTSVLFGHHASAHPLVHHVRVATREDPATARLGESFHRYALRAWKGGFLEGLSAETARMVRARRRVWRHPYLLYVAGGAGFVLLAAVLGGWKGLILYLGLAGYVQVQLLLSDYVQHYGLVRRAGPDGRPEAVSSRHSWNSGHPMSSALMLNAPRHSDHHAHPSRPYPALGLPEAAPMLPRSLPVMACLALWPRQWRRVMDPRAEAWRPEAGAEAGAVAGTQP